MTSEEPLQPKHPDLRIVLIGRVGSGKTAAMNTILRGSEENEKPASESQIGNYRSTEECQKKEGRIGTQNVLIVDTPGLCNADKTDEAVMDKIKSVVCQADICPHVFLFVLDLERFTDDQKNMVEFIWNTFGKQATKYAMVLLTHSNNLPENDPNGDTFISERPYLEDFVRKCDGGKCIIDNKIQDPSQVTKLLGQINKLVDKNKGKHYTCEMLEVAEKSSGIKKKIALSVNGSALAGAGVGAAATHFVGSSFGIPIGAAAGAAVGGVMGGVGIVASQYIKTKKCVIQ